MKISVIIPSYNEGNIIKITYKTISDVLKSDSLIKNYSYELIIIDDGSKDNTLSVIKELSSHDNHVKYISFSRNFGKEAGILAGLSYSTGDAVILIDADLQHPPKLIPEMISYFLKGFDQVIAKRNRTGDKKIKTFTAKLYYLLANHFIDVKLVNGIGDFRLLSRRVVNALLSMPENNRFSKGLFSWIGFDKKIIEYENQNRISGKSKWSFKKLFDYGINGILSFNNKPLRSIQFLGFVLIFLGIIFGCVTISSFLNKSNNCFYYIILFIILIINGIELSSIGILGEYIGKINYEVKNRPQYFIKESNIKLFNDKDNWYERFNIFFMG